MYDRQVEYNLRQSSVKTAPSQAQNSGLLNAPHTMFLPHKSKKWPSPLFNTLFPRWPSTLSQSLSLRILGR